MGVRIIFFVSLSHFCDQLMLSKTCLDHVSFVCLHKYFYGNLLIRFCNMKKLVRIVFFLYFCNFPPKAVQPLQLSPLVSSVNPVYSFSKFSRPNLPFQIVHSSYLLLQEIIRLNLLLREVIRLNLLLQPIPPCR